MKNKVFLGGTCAETIWRDDLIKNIQIDYFNPVVENWTEEDQQIEYTQKEDYCNIHFYMITSDMMGVFSIAEVIDSVHTKDKVTILHVNPQGFGESRLKSLQAVVDMVQSLGGIAYIDEELNRSARVLNYCFKD